MLPRGGASDVTGWGSHGTGETPDLLLGNNEH